MWFRIIILNYHLSAFMYAGLTSLCCDLLTFSCTESSLALFSVIFSCAVNAFYITTSYFPWPPWLYYAGNTRLNFSASQLSAFTCSFSTSFFCQNNLLTKWEFSRPSVDQLLFYSVSLIISIVLLLPDNVCIFPALKIVFIVIKLSITSLMQEIKGSLIIH